MIGVDIIGGGDAVVGAVPPVTTIVGPYHVLISPYVLGVVSFGDLFPPPDGHPPYIERVVLYGGKIVPDSSDKHAFYCTAPDKVEVYLPGTAAPQVYQKGVGDFAAGIKQVYVAGGTKTTAAPKQAIIKRASGWLARIFR